MSTSAVTCVSQSPLRDADALSAVVIETNAIDGKKTGRPVHPLWAFFHRGEKRNRYHYHAFCIYCVARYGAEHVAPTRGVSADMLRHIEKCTNCPRRVVESVKDICGRRDAVRVDRHQKKKADATGELQSSQATGAAADGQQQRSVSTATAPRPSQDMAQSLRDAYHRFYYEPQQRSSTIAKPANLSTAHPSTSPTARSGSELHRHTNDHTVRLALGKHASDSTAARAEDAASPSAKRARFALASSTTSEPQDSAAWRVQVLQAAVAAGLPRDALENSDVVDLLAFIAPPVDDTPALLASLQDPNVIQDAATALARTQLDRVKEGMHDSTIKGGLTLSLTSWATLDLQQLVAFTLVNSNGDAACVGILDMGTQADAYDAPALALKIEDVLATLATQDICVIAIVADSVLALNAARYVCLAPTRRSLLVVPCFARELSALAGSLLTHARFSDAVGHMVEVASYFASPTLARVLAALVRERDASDTSDAHIPLPNRRNWFSFVDCIAAMLKYCDVVTAICTGEPTTAALEDVVVPPRLKELVFADDGKLWKTLEDLHALLLPLTETYALVFAIDDRASDSAGAMPAHGLTLAHVMYQLARMHQQYAALRGTHDDALAAMMQARLRVTWTRYDLPAMALAYVFNFHLDTALLNTATAGGALDWDAMAMYFQSYFASWFSAESSASDSQVASDNSVTHTTAAPALASGEAAPATDSTEASSVLRQISTDKVHELLHAYKTQQFPFDADTTSDYVDVSSFYSFVSDSYPELCALCCRLYAVALLSANVQRVVCGIGFVPTTTLTTTSPSSVELLLHIGFASSMRRVASPLSRSSARAVMQSCDASEIFWNADVWDEFATDWRLFLDRELAMDEFDAITAQHSTRSTGDSSESMALLERHVPLDDVFVGTLPTLLPPQTPPAAATPGDGPSPPTTTVDNSVVL